MRRVWLQHGFTAMAPACSSSTGWTPDAIGSIASGNGTSGLPARNLHGSALTLGVKVAF